MDVAPQLYDVLADAIFFSKEHLVANRSTTWKRLQCGGFAVLVRRVLCRSKKLIWDVGMSGCRTNVRGMVCGNHFLA